MRVIRFETTASTNTYVKELLIKEGLPDGETLLVTAEEQTAGRGRLGKSFFSPKGCGLYMTVAFYVGKRPEDALFITSAAAVAAADVLDAAGAGDLKIKWVNDIFQNDRKVCGILTEAVTDPDTGIMKYAVVGAGINIDADESLLPEVAGTLKELSLSKEELSVVLAAEIEKKSRFAIDSEEGRKEVLRQYRERSLMPGREVFWEDNGRTVTGLAVDIDDECRLVVDSGGERRILDSGFISVRPLL